MPTLRRLMAETAGGLPRAFWYLWAGTLINRTASFVAIFMAFYLTEARGFSATFTGVVIGLQGGGGAIGVLVGGVLADRWGRRPTLLLGHLGTAATALGLGLSTGPAAIVAWSAAFGVLSNAARPAFGAMMVDIVPEQDRVRAFSLNYLAINLGFAVAALLAGLVAQVDYLLLFVLDAATSLITVAIIYAKITETRPQSGVNADALLRTSRPQGLRTVLCDRVFVVFAGLNLLVMIVFMQHISSLPLAMQHDGLAPSSFGVVISLNAILIVTGQLFIPRLLRGHGHSRVLAAAALLTGIGFGMTALAGEAWFYAVTVLIWTFGEMAMAPTSSAIIAELSPTQLRGRYQSVFSLSFALAALLAPILGGWVIQHYGDSTLWVGCLVLGVLAAAGHLAANPARRRRMADLRAADLPAARSTT